MNDNETEYKGYTIRIEQDTDATSPREWDNLGTMVCWHRRDILGDEQPKESPAEWLQDKIMQDYVFVRGKKFEIPDLTMAQLWERFERDNLVIPIMAYEHGSITIRAYNYGNFPDQQWDCGQLGFIYVSHKKIKEEYGNAGKVNIEKARQCLLSEIKTYDQWLTGDVYGYIVEDDDENHIDSCWGYYGEDEAIADAKSGIDYREAEAKKKAWEKYIEQQPYLIGMEA